MYSADKPAYYYHPSIPNIIYSMFPVQFTTPSNLFLAVLDHFASKYCPNCSHTSRDLCNGRKRQNDQNQAHSALFLAQLHAIWDRWLYSDENQFPSFHEHRLPQNIIGSLKLVFLPWIVQMVSWSKKNDCKDQII